jgi:ribosomal protein S18 acetylase RimI-like enzyme
MIVHPEIHLAYAKARSDELRREAARQRVTRQVRAVAGNRRRHPRRGFGFRLNNPRTAVLRDGSVVLIRQVTASDAPLLVDGFSRLSERSRWMRFLLAKKVLTSAEVSYLTKVDHRDHEALGALEQNTDKGVGIARYIRDANDPRSAEIAVTVVDDWQHRGLGSELVSRLAARAREEGIHRFTALVAANNVQATSMLRKFSATLIRRNGHDAEYAVTLNLHRPAAPPSPAGDQRLPATAKCAGPHRW